MYAIHLKAKKGNRIFYAARFGDGSGLFCINRPYSQSSKKVSVPIYIGLFDAVTQKYLKTFLIEIRDGNGFNTPVTLNDLKVNDPVHVELKSLRYGF